MDSQNLSRVIASLDKHIKDLERQEGKYESYYDDLCLARFLKACAERDRVFPSSLTLSGIREQGRRGTAFHAALEGLEVADSEFKPSDSEVLSMKYSMSNFEAVMRQSALIKYDHWLLPYARFEMGSTYMRVGKYAEARREFDAALNGGKSKEDTEVFGNDDQNSKISMSQLLSLRSHNACIKLDALEKAAKK